MVELMIMESPLGNIKLIAEDDYLLSLQFTEEEITQNSPSSFLLNVKEQLELYFEGKLKLFDIPVGLIGSTFQQKVWMEANKVPFGKTTSYHTIAHSLDNPKAVRAVGAANGANPILIVIPCHRIIAKSGQLTGYAGGLWRKLKLLQLEAKDQPGNQYSLGF